MNSREKSPKKSSKLSLRSLKAPLESFGKHEIDWEPDDQPLRTQGQYDPISSRRDFQMRAEEPTGLNPDPNLTQWKIFKMFSKEKLDPPGQGNMHIELSKNSSKYT